MEGPVVSVVVPVYNAEAYLEECILSILSQSCKNIELILVNDGSNDKSEIICQRFLSDSRVIYIRQENQGQTSARRRGVNVAKGEWITFVDADDWLDPRAVEYLLSISLDADIVVGGSKQLAFVLRFFPDYLKKEKYIKRMCRDNIFVYPWAKLIRRNLFNEKTFLFPFNVRYGEDILMNLRLAEENKLNIRICKMPIYNHRNNRQSISHLFNYSFDYFGYYCPLVEKLINNISGLRKDEVTKIIIIRRMKAYFLVLRYNEFKVGNPEHPFIDEIRKLFHTTDSFYLIDKIAINTSNRLALRLLYYVSRIRDRFRFPYRILYDLYPITIKLFPIKGSSLFL